MFGDVSEEGAEGDGDAGAADVAEFRLWRVEQGDAGAGRGEALFEKDDEGEQGEVLGGFGVEDRELAGGKRERFGVSEEAVEGLGDVADVKAGGREAVGAAPEVVVREAAGLLEDVFLGLL